METGSVIVCKCRAVIDKVQRGIQEGRCTEQVNLNTVPKAVCKAVHSTFSMTTSSKMMWSPSPQEFQKRKIEIQRCFSEKHPCITLFEHLFQKDGNYNQTREIITLIETHPISSFRDQCLSYVYNNAYVYYPPDDDRRPRKGSLICAAAAEGDLSVVRTGCRFIVDQEWLQWAIIHAVRCGKHEIVDFFINDYNDERVVKTDTKARWKQDCVRTAIREKLDLEFLRRFRGSYNETKEIIRVIETHPASELRDQCLSYVYNNAYVYYPPDDDRRPRKGLLMCEAAGQGDLSVVKTGCRFIFHEAPLLQAVIHAARCGQHGIVDFFIKDYNDERVVKTCTKARWVEYCVMTLLDEKCDLKFLKLFLHTYAHMITKSFLQGKVLEVNRKGLNPELCLIFNTYKDKTIQEYDLLEFS